MLASLLAQTDRDFELIIIDQNQDGRVASMLEPLRSAGIAVEHVRLKAAGSSRARNVGTTLSRADLIGYPDDDCYYEPEVIARARAHFAVRADADGLIGSWPEYDRGVPPPAYRLSLATWRQFKDWGAPCFALFFRAERLKMFGPFDEVLGPGSNYGAAEETDLLMRALELGGQIDFVPDVVVHHPFVQTPALTRRQFRRARLYGRGTGALLVKHRMPAVAYLKGVVSPLIRAATAPRPVQALVLGTLTTYGRIEGMIAWRLWHSPSRGNGAPAG